MYRHFTIRKLKNYAKFCELKCARARQINLLTLAVLKSEGDKRQELELLLRDKQKSYVRAEKERKNMEMHLLALCDEQRQILTDFYIRRERNRYSKYYAKYGADFENIKNQALDSLAEIILKSRKLATQKRHSK